MDKSFNAAALVGADAGGVHPGKFSAYRGAGAHRHSGHWTGAP